MFQHGNKKWETFAQVYPQHLHTANKNIKNEIEQITEEEKPRRIWKMEWESILKSKEPTFTRGCYSTKEWTSLT